MIIKNNNFAFPLGWLQNFRHPQLCPQIRLKKKVRMGVGVGVGGQVPTALATDSIKKRGREESISSIQLTCQTFSWLPQPHHHQQTLFLSAEKYKTLITIPLYFKLIRCILAMWEFNLIILCQLYNIYDLQLWTVCVLNLIKYYYQNVTKK